jgi:rhamnulokinase
MARYYLACDLGAESGRVMLGALHSDRLDLEEIHRFPNQAIRSGDSLRWNIPQLFQELLAGLLKAAERSHAIESVSTDSWGVDYTLLDPEGGVLEPVHHYRDPRCAEGVLQAHSKASQEEIFAETGIQFMPINTIYQLASEPKERLARAKQALSIADTFNYLLSGRAVVERSNASTFQLYNPIEGTWAWKLIEKLGFPKHLFGEIVSPGAKLGKIREEVAAQTGLSPDVEVIATCSHDTGAAVAGVPAQQGKSNWAYLSSGTWSLMGVEIDKPLINEKSRALNFTNEIGFNHSVRLLKNIIGLWLVQELRRAWREEGKEFDYPELTRLAAEAEPFRSLINPASPEFLAPRHMPSQIAEYCRSSGQPVPSTPGEYIRCILESLALLYRRTLRQLQDLAGHEISVLHVVGGGSKNELLNQFTADAAGITVLAGPVEATAAGNILIQAIALGHVSDLAAARRIVANSARIQTFAPRNTPAWDAAWTRFSAIASHSRP